MTPLQSQSDEARMASYIKRIATGPQMSKDLNRDEARDGMTLILEGRVHEVQAAVFLIALRMKRETDEENLGVMEALRGATRSAEANVPELLDLADPYDGFNRHLPAAPFLPALLAACGLPAISHGCEQMGPKYGVTHRQILSAAGARVDLTPEEAAQRVSSPNVGWAYIDQASSCPGLHRLIELRRLMVKRPLLSTLEKLCGPVRATGKNDLLVGYVHKGYEQLLALAARHVGYDTSMIIRGVEGGVIPSISKPMDCILYREGGETKTVRWDPKEAGVESSLRAVPLPSSPQGPRPSQTGFALDGEESDGEGLPVLRLAEEAALAGLAALSGTPGPTRDSLVYMASAVLYSLGRFDSISAAASLVRLKLDARSAEEHFRRGS